MPNRLADATSPYLQQHAADPGRQARVGPRNEVAWIHAHQRDAVAEVVLTADRAALRARVEGRGGRFDAGKIEHLDEMLGSMLFFDWSGWLEIDTTGLTPNQVAARILSEF